LAGCSARPQMAAEYDDDASGTVPRDIVKENRFAIVAQTDTTQAYNRGALLGAGGAVAVSSNVDDGLYDDLPTADPGFVSGGGQSLRQMEGMPDSTITQEQGRAMPDGRQGQEPYVAGNEGEMLRPGESASDHLRDSFQLDDLANANIEPKLRAEKPATTASNPAAVTTQTAGQALASASVPDDVKTAVEQMEKSARAHDEITGGGEDFAQIAQADAAAANAPTAIQGLPEVTSETETQRTVQEVTQDTLSDGTVQTTRDITAEPEELTSTAVAPAPVATTVPEVEVGAQPAVGAESADAALAGEMDDMAGEQGTTPPPEAPVDLPVAQKGPPDGEQVVPDDPASDAALAAQAEPAEPAEVLPGSETEIAPAAGTLAESEPAMVAEDAGRPVNDARAGDAQAEQAAAEAARDLQSGENPPDVPAAPAAVDEVTAAEGAPAASVSTLDVDESQSLAIPEMNVGRSNQLVAPEMQAAAEETAEPADTDTAAKTLPEPAEAVTATTEETASSLEAATEETRETALSPVASATTEAAATVEEETAEVVSTPEPVAGATAEAETASETEVSLSGEASAEEFPAADKEEPFGEETATGAALADSVSESAAEAVDAASEMTGAVADETEGVQLAMRDEVDLPEADEPEAVGESAKAESEALPDTATASDKPADEPGNFLDGVPVKDITPPDPMPDNVAVISTRLGDIVIALDGKAAPQAVTSFTELAKEKFYDRTTFHRVIPNFIIQGGDPNSKEGARATHGEGGPGFVLRPEISLPHKRGSVAAARLPDDVNPLRYSNGSQFFICVADAPYLDGTNTVFGQVVQGMEVVDKIASLPRDDEANPLRPLRMDVKVMKREEWEQD
ncbi:MAG: peptidylprolyl isomerase, partial [Verrucomicrobiota bacterium]